MANGGIVGPVQTPVVTPAGSQPETITGITSPNPAFAVQPLTTSVTVMVIAGGGGGQVAGGGAGGLRIISNHPVPLSPFPVTIGAGGPGTNASLPQAGSNSTFGSTVPISSSGGGAWNYGAGGPGGSGSGAASGPGTTIPGPAGNIGGYSPPEGNPGGSSNSYAGAGGGGSVGAGSVSGGWPGTGGPGGAGTNTAPTFGAAPQPYYPAKSPGPTNAYFAGGGGGSSTAASGGVGGTGGGGSGVNGPPGLIAPSGDTNSGSGGGSHFGDGGSAGAGGSGMVIVKEAAISTPASIVAPGVWRMSEVYDYRKSGDWLGN